MASKKELQDTLKEKYGINKNISKSLGAEECAQIIKVLQSEPTAVKLIASFAQKNSNLGQNNAYYSRMRSQAEKKLKSTKSEYLELEKSIKIIENSKTVLAAKKKQMEQEKESLEADVESLSSQNNFLANQVQGLTNKNDELTVANEKLKKDNKDLKNIVDAIRLRLARDTQELLKYEDSEIRKVLIRLFRWTLG